METWNELVAAELRWYLRWLRAMETTVPADQPYHSRSYEGKLLHMYTQVGRNYYTLNETFVSLAGVGVKAEYWGKGLFSSLLQHIEIHKSQL